MICQDVECCISYEFFTHWHATLLKKIDINDKLKKDIIFNLISSENKILSCIEGLVNGVFDGDGIEYIEEKKHLRFPIMMTNVNCDDKTIPVYCKIRINPCFDIAKEGEAHTKIWVIFYNSFSDDIHHDSYKKFCASLSDLSNQISSAVRRYIDNAIDKETEQEYSILLIFNSLSNKFYDMYKEIFYKFSEVNNFGELQKEYSENKKCKCIFDSLVELAGEVSLENNIKQYSPCKNYDIAWRTISSHYLKSFQFIKSDDSSTKISSISQVERSIASPSERLRTLYSEPLMKAIDFSEKL